jgi:exodeoxyribonuclease-3
LKILTWNIRQGGSKARLPQIIDTLTKHSADVIVLTEFWGGGKGECINSKLREAGYYYQVSSNPDEKVNGILIASKQQIERLPSPGKHQRIKERWLEVSLPRSGLYILGIHIPTKHSELHSKKEFWQEFKQYAHERLETKTIIIGDFNTGLEEDAEGAPLYCREDMQAVLDIGWIDCWRYTHGSFKQYTWYSNTGNGFRIDHALISPYLKERLLESYFSHSERLQKISDHSLLSVELNL